MNITQEQVQEVKQLTYGEKAVGINFNPSEDVMVDKIKRHFADAIDLLNSLRINEIAVSKTGGVSNPEKIRLYSVAITELQTAQMWAVKAYTWRY